MNPQATYNELCKNIKEMEQIFELRRSAELKLNKTEAIDAHLFGNLPDELRKSEGAIKKLATRNFGLSCQLRALGWGINGADYSLVPYVEGKVHIESAMFGFITQY